MGNPGEKGIYFEKNKELHEEEVAGIVVEYEKKNDRTTEQTSLHTEDVPEHIR